MQRLNGFKFYDLDSCHYSDMFLDMLNDKNRVTVWGRYKSLHELLKHIITIKEAFKPSFIIVFDGNDYIVFCKFNA